jgi:hypothetical protein
LRELLDTFGQATGRRRLIGLRLRHVYALAIATGYLRRFVVFGSFVTGKPDPNDVDVLLIMDDAFDVGNVAGEARLVFDHAAAQARLGASVFWLRRLAAFPDEERAVQSWQLKRDGTLRGIVEIVETDS